MKDKLLIIEKWLVSIMPQYDRLMHFFGGFLIFILTQLFFEDLTALLIVTVCGIIKELNDKYIKKTKFDIIDLGFTILSGTILTIL